MYHIYILTTLFCLLRYILINTQHTLQHHATCECIQSFMVWCFRHPPVHPLSTNPPTHPSTHTNTQPPTHQPFLYLWKDHTIWMNVFSHFSIPRTSAPCCALPTHTTCTLYCTDGLVHTNVVTCEHAWWPMWDTPWLIHNHPNHPTNPRPCLVTSCACNHTHQPMPQSMFVNYLYCLYVPCPVRVYPVSPPCWPIQHAIDLSSAYCHRNWHLHTPRNTCCTNMTLAPTDILMNR
jgi:hypothetical protein